MQNNADNRPSKTVAIHAVRPHLVDGQQEVVVALKPILLKQGRLFYQKHAKSWFYVRSLENFMKFINDPRALSQIKTLIVSMNNKEKMIVLKVNLLLVIFLKYRILKLTLQLTGRVDVNDIANKPQSKFFHKIIVFYELVVSMVNQSLKIIIRLI
jgi:hypothetical protein